MSFNYSKYKKEIPSKSKKKKEVKHSFVAPPVDEPYPKWFARMKLQNGYEHSAYPYYSNGNCMFVIRRYEPGELKGSTKKQLAPWAYCEIKKEWCKGIIEDNRPLFRTDFIHDPNKQELPVVIVEGEKAVVSGDRKLNYKGDYPDLVSDPKYNFVTWSGGSNSVHKSDFSKLENKKIILFPDNDEEGFKAMHHVAKILIENSITEDISIIEGHKGFEDGWDIADSIDAPGVTPESLIEGAKEYIPDDGIWEKVEEEYSKRAAKEAASDFINKYVYVRDRKEFFEMESHKFVDKTQVNDWYFHITKNMSMMLLKDQQLVKVHSYLTHAGLEPGVIEVKPNQVPGVPAGVYLNNFKGSTVKPIQAVTETDKALLEKNLHYFRWLLPNWNIIEQIISYILRHPGKKILWCTLIVSKTEGAGKGLLASIIQGMLGADNVEINVSHSQMTGKHMTVIEGKQLIILNEVLISGTGLEKKEITNKMKSLFTDPTIVIEPKGKPQITIPNFCNFFIFSNDEACLHLNKESRRYFVEFIKHDPESIKTMLEDEGHKDSILAALNGEGINHLKYYFMNEVEIPDMNIFHTRAPQTDDMIEMVERSRPESIRLLDSALQDNLPPFRNYYLDDAMMQVDWWHSPGFDGHRTIRHQFSGMAIRDELFQYLKTNKKFQGLFLTLDLVEEWLKEKCTKWPDGKTTRQIVMPGGSLKINASRPRAYLIKNLTLTDYASIHKPMKLSELSQGQLGRHHSAYSYGGDNFYREHFDNQHSQTSDLAGDVHRKSIC